MYRGELIYYRKRVSKAIMLELQKNSEIDKKPDGYWRKLDKQSKKRNLK